MNLSKSEIRQSDVSKYMTELWGSYLDKDSAALSKLDKIILINVADFISLGIRNNLLKPGVYTNQVLDLARSYLMDSSPKIQGTAILVLGRSGSSSDIEAVFKYITNLESSDYLFRIAAMSIISKCNEESSTELLVLSQELTEERRNFISDNLNGFESAGLCHSTKESR